MLKIGDFSSLAQVSIKTLRYYDERRLLSPAHVDSETGYRFYSASQLSRLPPEKEKMTRLSRHSTGNLRHFTS
jgi:MerR family regulatory protein